MNSALSTLNTTTEVPLSKAPNPQLLPVCRSINGCPLLWVCVHFHFQTIWDFIVITRCYRLHLRIWLTDWLSYTASFMLSNYISTFFPLCANYSAYTVCPFTHGERVYRIFIYDLKTDRHNSISIYFHKSCFFLLCIPIISDKRLFWLSNNNSNKYR